MNFIQKICFISNRLPDYIESAGGSIPLFKKAASVIIAEGLPGIKIRILRYEQSRQLPPPSMKY